jgi:hypothetical protein
VHPLHGYLRKLYYLQRGYLQLRSRNKGMQYTD